MTPAAVEQLREKARDYELNALAQADRGDTAAATQFTTIAIALFEVAEILEQEAA